MSNPYLKFGLTSMVGAAALALGLSLAMGPLPAWLLSINIIGLVLYRYDKFSAGSSRGRVPERVLLLIHAAGGSLGAAAAMWLIRPRHKTRSVGFLLWFAVIACSQLFALATYFYLVGPRLR